MKKYIYLYKKCIFFWCLFPRDSLDVYHHVISDTTVRVIKLAELGLDPWQTLIAIIMVVAGFLTFYVIPLSFVLNDIALFLAILMIILLGMVLGLTLLAHIFQPHLERLFA